MGYNDTGLTRGGRGTQGQEIDGLGRHWRESCKKSEQYLTGEVRAVSLLDKAFQCAAP